jgi:dTMP kinase
MKWIVVDGIDGSGKNTFAHWIEELYRSKGNDVVLFFHPSDRYIGKLGRKALRSKGTLMHALASIYYIGDVLISVRKVKKLRKTDNVVVFVRYLMGVAYLPERYMKFGYKLFSKFLPIPKALLLVDIEPQLAYQRIRQRTDEKEMFEDLENLDQARRKTRTLAENGWYVIDNSGLQSDSFSKLVDLLDDWESKGLTVFE